MARVCVSVWKTQPPLRIENRREAWAVRVLACSESEGVWYTILMTHCFAFRKLSAPCLWTVRWYESLFLMCRKLSESLICMCFVFFICFAFYFIDLCSSFLLICPFVSSLYRGYRHEFFFSHGNTYRHICICACVRYPFSSLDVRLEVIGNRHSLPSWSHLLLSFLFSSPAKVVNGR